MRMTEDGNNDYDDHIEEYNGDDCEHHVLLQVFLRYYHVEQLNTKLAEFEQRVAVCQKYIRSFVARRNYERLLAAVKK